MWQVVNHTPYAAERGWIRDKHGAHCWIVAVKASFRVDPEGKLSLADEQPAPLLAPEFYGADGASSLRYDADLVPRGASRRASRRGASRSGASRSGGRTQGIPLGRPVIDGPLLELCIWTFGQ